MIVRFNGGDGGDDRTSLLKNLCENIKNNLNTIFS